MIPIESLLPLLRDPRDGGALRFEPDGRAGGGWLRGDGSGARYAVRDELADFLGEGDPASDAVSLAQHVMEARPFAWAYRRFWREHGLRAVLSSPLDLESEYTLWRALLAPAAGRPLLDLSCGPGVFTWSLARDHAGDPVVGLDRSPAMLEQALARDERHEVHEISFVRGDATRLPFVDASFGAVLNLTALHLYPDADAVFREVRRVLEPGGLYVATALVPEAPITPRRAARRLGATLSRLRLHAEPALRARLIAAGFDTFERITLGPTLVLRATVLGGGARSRCATCPGATSTTEPPPPDPELEPAPPEPAPAPTVAAPERDDGPATSGPEPAGR